MALHLISPTSFPTYLARSTDIINNKLHGAGIIGGTVYLEDTLTWKIVSGDNLKLIDFKFPANYSALPSAASQQVSTNEDTEKSITLSGTKSDTVPLEYIITIPPQNGIITGTLPGIKYVPNENFNGTDEFTFVVNDGLSNSMPAKVSITVVAVNDAPVAEDQVIETNEDTPLDIVLVATDVDGDELTYSIIDAPTHGDLTGTAPDLTYTPDANYAGADSFTFKVNDGTVDSAPAVVSITVNPINDAPIANDQTISVVPNGNVQFVLDYSDVDNVELTYTVTVEPLHGDLTGIAPNLTYTPDTDYHGTDSFEYTIDDLAAPVTGATVSIIVNTTPVATSQPGVTATQGVGEEITLTGLDADSDALTYAVVGEPLHGTITGTAPILTYTADSEYTGLDSFTFKVNDGYVDSELATVDIVVSAP